jgi:hypothetical protein
LASEPKSILSVFKDTLQIGREPQRTFVYENHIYLIRNKGEETFWVFRTQGFTA